MIGHQRRIELLSLALGLTLMMFLAMAGTATAETDSLEGIGDPEADEFVPVSMRVLFGVLVGVTVLAALATAFVMVRRGSVGRTARSLIPVSRRFSPHTRGRSHQ